MAFTICPFIGSPKGKEMSENLEARLDYLESCNDELRMQNRVLAAAIKGLLRGLPADMAQDAVETIQLAFEDEVAELHYTDSQHADLFQDAAYAFFRDKS